MGFRFKAFAWHLAGSASALALTLGLLYLAWYHWPGWYLADMPTVLMIMVGVDVVLGPLLTFIVADPAKARRVLARDVAAILLVQLVAFGYGVTTLWHGRPLYYAFSVNCLSLIQAQDIEQDPAAAGAQNSELAPHWYSLPRWIWAPLPENSEESDRIIRSAITGGDDVVSMPRYFKNWQQGLPALREQLKKVDDLGYFSRPDKTALKERMRAAGLSPEQPNSLPFTGRGPPLLAVFDPTTLKIKAIFKAE